MRVRDESSYHCVGFSSSQCLEPGRLTLCSFVSNLKDEHLQSRQRLKEAEDRVAQLEAALSASGHAPPPRTAPQESESDMAGFAQQVLALGAAVGPIENSTNPSSTVYTPTPDIIERCAQAYVDTYTISQPFILDTELRADIREVYPDGSTDTTAKSTGPRDSLCTMVLAAGAFVAEARGDVPPGTATSLRHTALQALPPLTSENLNLVRYSSSPFSKPLTCTLRRRCKPSWL